MPLNALNHYTLRPVDLEATKEFYAEMLGLPDRHAQPTGLLDHIAFSCSGLAVDLNFPPEETAGQRVMSGTRRGAYSLSLAVEISGASGFFIPTV
jgi:catechol 2,3-dioxygenase-like lactoylglutathione lyase family enzyme